MRSDLLVVLLYFGHADTFRFFCCCCNISDTNFPVNVSQMCRGDFKTFFCFRFCENVMNNDILLFEIYIYILFFKWEWQTLERGWQCSSSSRHVSGWVLVRNALSVRVRVRERVHQARARAHTRTPSSQHGFIESMLDQQGIIRYDTSVTVRCTTYIWLMVKLGNWISESNKCGAIRIPRRVNLNQTSFNLLMLCNAI